MTQAKLEARLLCEGGIGQGLERLGPHEWNFQVRGLASKMIANGGFLGREFLWDVYLSSRRPPLKEMLPALKRLKMLMTEFQDHDLFIGEAIPLPLSQVAMELAF